MCYNFNKIPSYSLYLNIEKYFQYDLIYNTLYILFLPTSII